MAETSEQRWSVRAIQYIRPEAYRITWATGEMSLEPLEMLDNIHEVFLTRAKEVSPYYVIISFLFVKRYPGDSFRVWITNRDTISYLRLSQFPQCAEELLKLDFGKKTTFCGSSSAETPGYGQISSSIDGQVGGGCVQRSLSLILKEHSLDFEASGLQNIIRDTSYVSMSELQRVCEANNLPFRVFRVKRKQQSNGYYLRVIDDHCEFIRKASDQDINNPLVNLWKFEMLKVTKKRARNWEQLK
jgi:hypothetical protein